MSWAQAIIGGGVGGTVVGGVFELVRRKLDQRDAARARHRDSDARVLRAFRELVPEAEIRFLREHDFGASWRNDSTTSIEDYCDGNLEAPDLVLVSSTQLEQLRLSFVHAVRAWFGEMAGRSIPHDRIDTLQVLIGRESAEPDRVLGENRTILNDTSTEAARAYDAFMALARRELPEAFGVEREP